MERASRILASLLTLMLSAAKAHAVCPVCTILVVSGVGLSHHLGIDDTITGIWIGSLILSMSLTTNYWLKKRNIKLRFQKLSLIVIFYVVTLFFLYRADFLGITGNTLWGYDKLLLGIAIGSIVFLFGVFVDLLLRALNNCKVYFPFQKVILPISFISIASLFFYCTC